MISVIIKEVQLPISIIIPTFNEEKDLPQLLQSIRAQTMEPAEIIVADAFSIDRTRDIARSFGCNVVDGGLPSKARNNGARVATQKILLFLDADVVLPNRFLEETISEMVKRNLDVTSCFVYPISTYKIDSVLHGFVNYYLKFTRPFYPHIPGCCIFVRESLHKKIEGFNESLKLAEDHDYVQRAKKHGRFAYLNSYKIPISVRRLTKEGRLRIILKYLAIEFHLIFIGQIKTDIFSYRFGNLNR